MSKLGSSQESTGENQTVDRAGDSAISGGAPAFQEQHAHDRVHATVSSLLPWGVSIVFHVGLVVLAILVVWSTLNRPEPENEALVIPHVTLNDLTDQQLKPITDRRPIIEPRTQEPITPRPRPQEDQPSPMPNPDPSIPLTGVHGAVVTDITRPLGVVDGTGSSRDSGATFMPVPGNVKRIAYVIDASGSLLDAMPIVINHLRQSMGQLRDAQSFTIIFAKGSDAIEVPPRGLKIANIDNRRRVSQWIDITSGNVVPAGSSDPVVAIKKALKYKPQLIYLLSDNITGQGRYETNQKHLLAQIRKTNTTGTKINAIQFLYPDPLEQIGLESTMKLISHSTGGVYTFVDGRELGIRW